jgi:hypothetical protein
VVKNGYGDYRRDQAHFKFNYFTSLKAHWKFNVPDGPNADIEVNQNIPVYKKLFRHVVSPKSLTRYCGLENGVEQGWGFVMLNKEKDNPHLKKMQRRFQCEYQNGVEIFRNPSLMHIDPDRWLVNLICCLVCLLCLVLSQTEVLPEVLLPLGIAFYFI